MVITMNAPLNKSSLRTVDQDQADSAEVRQPQPAAEKGAASAQPATNQKSAQPEAPKKKRRSLVLPIIVLAALGGIGWYGYNWWIDGRFLVSTDDAYISGDISVISPKVTGYVQKVDVIENQKVKAGDPLVTLDQGDYKIALEQAQANVESAKLAVSRIDVQIVGGEASLAQSQAQIGALQATLRGAEITQKRASELAEKSVGTAANLDTAQTALDLAKANLVAGQAAVVTAQASVELLKAQRLEAANTVKLQQYALDQAKRDLDFTVLKAPYDGTIGNLSVHTGDYVTAGKRLASLVPMSELYVSANFKETQIGDIHPGAKVRLHVDAYDHQVLEGTVVSLSPASGTVFSLLPAENATGNFTKVVQRVPVRIAFPKQELEKGYLRAGLSVVAEVDTRTNPNGNNGAAH
jgi:membrane fusion protein (multidrug efflux system)